MSFDITATLHKVFDTESKTQTFQAREFVLKTDGQYPQFVKFQLTQDKCDLIDNHKEGDMIKVYFDLRGREWNEKYFTNLNAWRIEAGQAQAQDAPPIDGPEMGSNSPFSEPKMPKSGMPLDSYEGQQPAADVDDLPF